jgi:hypothetical protein
MPYVPFQCWLRQKNTAWALRILVFICIFALLGFFWLKIGLIAKLLVVNLKALLP